MPRRKGARRAHRPTRPAPHRRASVAALALVAILAVGLSAGYWLVPSRDAGTSATTPPSPAETAAPAGSGHSPSAPPRRSRRATRAGSDVTAAQPAAAGSAVNVSASAPVSHAWERHAVAMAALPDRPMIAIVIDDMGLHRANSNRAVALPGPLTLAYMAYADDLAVKVDAGRAAGHEILVHVPMEPLNGAEDPGPNALLTGLDDAELLRRLRWGSIAPPAMSASTTTWAAASPAPPREWRSSWPSSRHAT